MIKIEGLPLSDSETYQAILELLKVPVSTRELLRAIRSLFSMTASMARHEAQLSCSSPIGFHSNRTPKIWKEDKGDGYQVIYRLLWKH